MSEITEFKELLQLARDLNQMKFFRGLPENLSILIDVERQHMSKLLLECERYIETQGPYYRGEYQPKTVLMPVEDRLFPTEEGVIDTCKAATIKMFGICFHLLPVHNKS